MLSFEEDEEGGEEGGGGGGGLQALKSKAKPKKKKAFASRVRLVWCGVKSCGRGRDDAPRLLLLTL